jgi:hypothetical protein
MKAARLRGIAWLAGALVACEPPVPVRPDLDCEDEQTWSDAPEVERDTFPPLRAIAACSPIARAYVALPLSGAGDCVRIRDLDAGTPARTSMLDEDGLVLTMTPSSAYELEIRRLELSSTERRWVLVRERPADGIVRVEPSRTLAILRVPRALLDGAYADDENVRTTSEPAAVAPHFDALAFGDVRGYPGFVAQSGAQLVLRLLSPRPVRGILPGVLAADLVASASDDPVLLGGTGVATGATFHALSFPPSEDVVSTTLGAEVDELGAANTEDGGPTTYLRIGTTLHRADARGLATLGVAVSRVLDGGCFLDVEGRLVDDEGRALGGFDASIGRPLACHAGVVLGERGLAAIARGEVVGPTARLFDPEDEGRLALTGPRGAYATERPDGSSLIYLGDECR